jgi:hypothetical protein
MPKWTCCKGHFPTGVPGSTNWPTETKTITTSAGLEVVLERKSVVQVGSREGEEVSFHFLLF